MKSAIRLLPIFPGDFDLHPLGFKFFGNYYIDKFLPIGCAISFKVFKEFSTFLQWVSMQNSKLTTIHHYLEDFIFSGRDAESCRDIMIAFQTECKNLVFQLQKISQGQTTIIPFGAKF